MKKSLREFTNSQQESSEKSKPAAEIIKRKMRKETGLEEGNTTKQEQNEKITTKNSQHKSLLINTIQDLVFKFLVF